VRSCSAAVASHSFAESAGEGGAGVAFWDCAKTGKANDINRVRTKINLILEDFA
jgi:hypothetical protein